MSRVLVTSQYLKECEDHLADFFVTKLPALPKSEKISELSRSSINNPSTSKSNAFFSVNVVARKPEKSDPETNPYLQKFLRQIAWRPGRPAVFAGKLDYPRYRAFDRFMI